MTSRPCTLSSGSTDSFRALLAGLPARSSYAVRAAASLFFSRRNPADTQPTKDDDDDCKPSRQHSGAVS
eukprot:scaffold247738_cov17-Prasinocladus_malaysianus.AAC.1